MKSTKMSAILVFVLVSVLASMAHGKIILTVNTQNVSSITLELGQSCTVEVVSGDNSSYEAYVGFDEGLVVGDFSHLETRPEAGNQAEVVLYSTPDFRGYYVKASGGIVQPSPGVHFVFQFEAQQVGETDVKLYNETLKELDSLHITVIPAPMGTGFTYQGRLMDADKPADGLYDFEFKLYDSPAGGNQLASTIDINDLETIDGYFTVELDFNDANVFNGDACWLDIGVRPGASSGSFITLSPRQELTPTPYALYAGTDNDWMVSGNDMYAIPSGNVGIGTTNPEQNLSVWEGMNIDQSNSNDGTIDNGLRFGSDTSGEGIASKRTPGGNQYGLDFYTGYQNRMSITNWGNVGIGTTNPFSKLHVEDDTTDDVAVRIHNQNDAGREALYFGTSAASDAGITVWGPTHSTHPDEWTFFNNRTSGYFNWLTNNSTKMTLANNGNLGIGTTTPEQNLSVWEGMNIDQSNSNDGTIDNGLRFGSDTSGEGIASKRTPGGNQYGLDFYTGSQNRMSISNWGNVGIGTTNPGANLDVVGRIRVSNSTGDPLIELGEGLDYAEGFDVSDRGKIDTGSVLVIDPDNPGNLALSNKAYDKKVAGIVAGGKGLGSGVRLGAGQFDYDVALAGRVYCNVDATEAAVQPGDLLTTSATAGYAMKAVDHTRAQGAILGKAMETLEKGKRGQILVLVTLQ